MPFSDPTQQSKSNRLWFLLYSIAALTVVTIVVALYTVITRGGDRDAILDGIQQQVVRGRQSQQASSCTNFQNQRAIEDALRDIARLNGIKSGPPRVLPSHATLEACRNSGVEIKDGVPVAGQLPK